MKKTEIERIPILMPEEIGRLCDGVRIYDSSSSPEARVYFIDRDNGLYLKIGEAKSLEKEAMMTDYFHKKGLSAEILSYISGENDILLSRAVVGEDCTALKYLSEPKRLATLMGEKLRQLHETDFSDCPLSDVIAEYISLAEKNYREDSYNKEHFPDSFGYSSGEDAYRVLSVGKNLLKADCLIHGDYCLPNILLDGWSFSGFVDLGNGGIGDRHIDLFWGRWSIKFNLSVVAGLSEGELKLYGDRFFDAYGREKIDSELLSVVAAAEVFR